MVTKNTITIGQARRKLSLLALTVGIALAGCDLPGSDLPQNRLEATRFLNEATFGSSEAEINNVGVVGYTQWITDQLATQSEFTFKDYLEARKAETGDSSPRATDDYIYEAFYTRALTSKAQLRNRVLLALSEIFVVSMQDANILDRPEYLAAYLDLLDKGLDGTYRDLLQAIAHSQAMGYYLTYVSNSREDAGQGTQPDQNFAREVMQLFSIGLYQLNPDGTPKLDAAGKPIESYTRDDVVGLSKVFTGWTRNPGNVTSATRWDCFFVQSSCDGGRAAAYLPLAVYPEFHSTADKTFLGVTIPASGNPDPEGDMKIALDTLANHPNTAPFFSRQLIQRLVTSNPSPAYVQRVANKFTASGGNIGATVKAILLDTEARSLLAPSQGTFGKLREPILRMTALLRAFKFNESNLSPTGQRLNAAGKLSHVTIVKTSDLATSLNQTPFLSPSVFNFFRPGYVMPQSTSGQAGLVAPEFQLVSESTVTGYVNFLTDLLSTGVYSQSYGGDTGLQGPKLDVSDLRTAVDDAAVTAAVVDRLLGGKVSAGLQQAILDVLKTMPVPAAGSTQASIDARNAVLDQRAKAAILLVAASPEFLIQR